MEKDSYFRSLLRYVEANPLRAGLVAWAERWAWSSLGCDKKLAERLPDPWPLRRPRGWVATVNEALSPTDRAKIKSSFERDRPLGSDAWVKATALKLGLSHTLNPRGRPKKQEKL